MHACTHEAAPQTSVVCQFCPAFVQTLVIVVDSFSDVELLCDLLEASRKRNVSVHLLLDHLNLDLFVSMWQELKLNSTNFPVSHQNFKTQKSKLLYFPPPLEHILRILLTEPFVKTNILII